MEKTFFSGALCAALLFVGSLAFSAPGLINYSGRLTDNVGAAVTSPVTAKFTFWDAQSGGNQLGGSYEYIQGVTPNADGLYSISIGDAAGVGGAVPAEIFDADKVWLNVNIAGEDLAPRARISSVGYALRADAANGLVGSAHVTATATGTPAENGAALLAAYAKAKTLTPNGQPRSATNRVTVLVAPGQYDLGAGQLTMDAEFIDVAGISTLRENQNIFGWTSGAGTGVLRQTANDVRIENLLIDCRNTTAPAPISSVDFDFLVPAAYFPDDGTTNTVVRNVAFQANNYNTFSMRMQTVYNGHYEDCVAGKDAFGGSWGTASGTFVRCTAGNYAFGGHWGIANGTFEDCTGGDSSFGGMRGWASGTFRRCTGGDYAFGGWEGDAYGVFEYCTGEDYSFGADGGFASGTFIGCVGGDFSFGSVAGVAEGYFYFCRGGEESFGSLFGIASGMFEYCTGESYSFGSEGGIVNGVFTHCVGGWRSFGYLGETDGGWFKHCDGGSESFRPGSGTVFLYCTRGGGVYP